MRRRGGTRFLIKGVAAGVRQKDVLGRGEVYCADSAGDTLGGWAAPIDTRVAFRHRAAERTP